VRRAFLSILSLVGLPGCSKREPAPTQSTLASSCDWVSVVGVCAEVAAIHNADDRLALDRLARLCKSQLTAHACPTAKIVGSCQSSEDIVSHYYADGPHPYSAESARKQCQGSRGRWLE
jgi:hypothetical protein